MLVPLSRVARALNGGGMSCMGVDNATTLHLRSTHTLNAGRFKIDIPVQLDVLKFKDRGLGRLVEFVTETP